MKKILFLLLYCITGMQHSAYAQGLVTPTIKDKWWYSPANSVIGLNTAMINYPTGGGANTIYASAYYDASGSESIYVNDDATSGSPVLLTPSSIILSTPDIIIGNFDRIGSGCSSCTSPVTDYIVAVAYITTGGSVVIDCWDIYDDGSTISNAGFIGTISPSGTYVSNTVHLDVIAEATNTGATGLDLCNKFVVVWDDFTSASINDVYAAYGDLSAQTLGTPVQINPGAGSYGIMPDVAAIQENIGGIHDVGLFCYTNITHDTLLFYDYDFTSPGSISGTVTLDKKVASISIVVNTFMYPRIDAWDNVNFNIAAFQSLYKVVAQMDTSGSHIQKIRTYDDYLLTLSPPYWTSTNLINAVSITGYNRPYNHYMPSVAYGGPNEFMVNAFTEVSAGKDILFETPIFFNNPQWYSTNQYYEINSSPGSTAGTIINAGICNYANAVSTPANDPGCGVAISAWAYDTSGVSHVDYKIPNPLYAFRQGGNAAVKKVEGDAAGWQVFPNPAGKELVLKGNGMAATSYRVSDMAGRQVTEGAMGSSNRVNINMLTSGTYLLQLYDGMYDNGHVLFVKQ